MAGYYQMNIVVDIRVIAATGTPQGGKDEAEMIARATAAARVKPAISSDRAWTMRLERERTTRISYGIGRQAVQ